MKKKKLLNLLKLYLGITAIDISMFKLINKALEIRLQNDGYIFTEKYMEENGKIPSHVIKKLLVPGVRDIQMLIYSFDTLNADNYEQIKLEYIKNGYIEKPYTIHYTTIK